MASQVHRVKRGPKHPPVILPKDTWRGCEFVEADGTVLEVDWNGSKGPLPATGSIERGNGNYRKTGRRIAPGV
jgi:hypothetical protein